MFLNKIFSTNFKHANTKCIITFQRFSSICKKLCFDEFGDPLKVLKIQEEVLSSVKSDEVFIKFLVAPINPADINLIQGVYPVKVPLPAVGGNEGVGEVIGVGSKVNRLKPGDRVIPDTEGFGTWRSHGIFKTNQLFKVPNDVNIVEIAGISSNPCTAYRMLKDFVSLKTGDVVIQNGGNSACGQNVIQMCRINNFISVNIVRNRPEIDELKTYLRSLGANYVFTEEELRKTDLFKTNACPRPKLALNCVGGRSATEISRQLTSGGVTVTYGGMSREPVTIPTSTFIFKDISFRGYWMTRWTREYRESDERKRMIDEISDYMRTGKLKAPEHKLIPLSNYAEAIMKSTSVQGFTGCKYLFDLERE